MKKALYIFLALIFGIQAAFAQVDRSKIPTAGPAPEINIPKPETFSLPNGLKVFVVENHKLPKVAFSLVLNIEAVREGDKALAMYPWPGTLCVQALKTAPKTRSMKQWISSEPHSTPPLRAFTPPPYQTRRGAARLDD